MDVKSNAQNASNVNVGSILTFYIDNKKYGVDLLKVRDVIEFPSTTTVPMVDDYVEGVFNLRGRIVPIINLRTRFGMEKIDYDDRTCVIVIEEDGNYAGLIIDRVSDVFKYKTEDLQAVSDKEKNKFVKYILVMKDDIKFVINCKKIITE